MERAEGSSVSVSQTKDGVYEVRVADAVFRGCTDVEVEEGPYPGPVYSSDFQVPVAFEQNRWETNVRFTARNGATVCVRVEES